MSANIRLTNFKNKADQDKSLADYNAYLAKQIEVNSINSDAMQTYYRNKKLDIPTAPEQRKSADEELSDNVLQRDKAYKSLKSFMKDKDATNVLFKLQTDDEVALFNRFSELFKRDIKGQENITPIIFDSLWERYKDKLLATGNTGIPISTELGEYDSELSDISNMLADTKDLISKSIVGNLSRGIALAREHTVQLMGTDQKELNRIFEEAYEKKEGKTLVEREVIYIPLVTTSSEYEVRLSKKGETNGLWELRKTTETKWGVKNTEKIFYIIFAEYGVPFAQKIKWTGNPETARLAAAKAGISIGNPIPGNVHRPAIGGASLKPRKYVIGSGLIDIEEPKQLKIDEVCRRREAAAYTEPNFGNYVISLNSLKKGILHVRYPSGANIPHFPKQLISSILRKILNDLLFEKSFNEQDYDELDVMEQKMFDDLISLCKADKKNGIMLYKHKKYSDQDRDADVKRFNILRGELIAGNDNPSIIKELKQLLFKLMSQKCISRAEYNKIMERILILD